jgi:hypothetical protein
LYFPYLTHWQTRSMHNPGIITCSSKKQLMKLNI